MDGLPSLTYKVLVIATLLAGVVAWEGYRRNAERFRLLMVATAMAMLAAFFMLAISVGPKPFVSREVLFVPIRLSFLVSGLFWIAHSMFYFFRFVVISKNTTA